jgi:hypothetical protein
VEVAVSMPCPTAHSTVLSKAVSSSASMPNTKLPLTITPRPWRRSMAAA